MKKILFLHPGLRIFCAFALIFGCFENGYAQEKINVSISLTKVCTAENLPNVTVRLNGNSYQTNKNSNVYPGDIAPGNYQVSISDPANPDMKLAYIEYAISMESGVHHYDADASGNVTVPLSRVGSLTLYVACDNKKKIKVRIATTRSCTDAANEGYSVQEGITVSLGGKQFTSNANGVIETELTAGTYDVSAYWKDYALGYVAQNGLRQKIGENGLTKIQLTDQSQTLEVRMLTCEPNGQAKARATITEIGTTNVGPGSIRVTRSNAAGNGFVGMQLRDGDHVKINGTAKLKWLDGGGTISFANPRVSTTIIIGPDNRPSGNQAPESKSALQLLEGIIEFIMPVDEDKNAPRDENGNIIRFRVQGRSVAVGIKGTRFIFGYDPQTDLNTVIVKEGTVWVTPTNQALKPFTLQAGQQVQVAQNSVGPITQVNTQNTAINITGTWTMDDSQGGQTINVKQYGDQLTWTYNGGKGHETLQGTVYGKFDGRNFTGTYSNREGNITSSGTMNLVLNGDRLEGNWTSTTVAGQTGRYIMIRGVKSVPANNLSLTGSWVMDDGQVVQIVQNGSQFIWNYNGGRGHENLRGTVSGTFDGRNFYGTYNNREGNITSSGNINLVLNGNRLEGRWNSTTFAGQSGAYALTRR